MRVLHFCQSLPGGPASFFEEIATSQISALGAANVCFVLPAAQRSHVPSIPDESYRGFPNAGRDLLSLLSTRRFVFSEITRFNPTLIHLHSTFAGALVRLFPNRAIRKASVIYCPHGWAFGRLDSPGMVAAYATLERHFANHTDVIHHVSAHEQELAVGVGLPAHKMRTIFSGISDRLTSDQKTPRSNELRLLFVGRHDSEKGLDLLLSAFARLDRNDVHLDVVGAPVLSSGSARPLGVRRVKDHGWLDRATVFRMMAGADAVIVPSRREAFGLVAAEAMCQGTAVIASARGALPELVHHGHTGLLFDPDSPVDLLNVLQTLSREQLATFGANGRRRFESQFTADRMNGQLLNLYRHLALGTDAPPILTQSLASARA